MLSVYGYVCILSHFIKYHLSVVYDNCDRQRNHYDVSTDADFSGREGAYVAHNQRLSCLCRDHVKAGVGDEICLLWYKHECCILNINVGNR